ncbi:MAG: hypothetical protein AB7K63_06865 [Vicinamibacterales bacterium]
MPDPAQMHGLAIPASELADGTVTVRVVRQELANNIVGQDVSLTSEGRTRTVQTDDQGRAEFTNLPQGTQGTAQAVVDGETLTSQPFTIPTQGGLRVILVAGLNQAAAATEAANLPIEKGEVRVGPNSRIVAEFQDDTLNVFYLIDIINDSQARVDIGGPFAFELPSGAGGAGNMQGSSPQVTIDGDLVTVTGPFNPGTTPVQVGFQLRNAGSDYTLEQTFPITLQQVTVAVQKIGALSMTSTNFSQTGEIRADNGVPFIMATGPSLPANTPLVVEITGIPAHSQVPMYVTLVLAGAIAVAGIVLAVGRGQAEKDARQRLIARRDTLLGELAQLEERRRGGSETLRQSSRRNRILGELEQIYGELDESNAA